MSVRFLLFAHTTNAVQVIMRLKLQLTWINQVLEKDIDFFLIKFDGLNDCIFFNAVYTDVVFGM